MGKDEEKGRMKVRGVLFIKFDLPSQIVSGVVEGMDFVYPERFFVEGVESQSKAYEEANYQDRDFFLFRVIHNSQLYKA